MEVKTNEPTKRTESPNMSAELDDPTANTQKHGSEVFLFFF